VCEHGKAHCLASWNWGTAAAESFFSTLEREVLSRHHITTRDEAKRVVVEWVVNFYNKRQVDSGFGL
jgi:putative transposase